MIDTNRDSQWMLELTLAVPEYIILSSNNIQNGEILVPANPGPPGKWPLKRRVEYCSY